MIRIARAMRFTHTQGSKRDAASALLRGGGQGADEIGDEFGHVWLAGKLGDTLDDRAAYDDAVSGMGDLAGLIGIGNAKADGDGKVRGPPNGSYAAGHGRSHAGLLARNAFAGNVIDKTTRACSDAGDSLIGGGGSDEADTTRATYVSKFGCIFIGRKIEDEEAIDAGGLGIAMECLESQGHQGVDVGVEDDGNLRITPNLPDAIENAMRSRASIEGALRGELIDDAVSQGIGEWDTEFKDIDASLFQGEGKGASSLEAGIACADICNKCLGTPCAQGSKRAIDTILIHGAGNVGPMDPIGGLGPHAGGRRLYFEALSSMYLMTSPTV